MPGVDYTQLPGTVTIAAGQDEATIAVTPIDDVVPEVDKTVVLTLQPSTGDTVDPDAQEAVAILDDDLPTVSFVGTLEQTVDETPTGFGREVTFQAELSKPVPYAVDAYFEQLGDAVEGTDYTIDEDPVYFPPNDAGPQSVTVDVANDIILKDGLNLTAPPSPPLATNDPEATAIHDQKELYLAFTTDTPEYLVGGDPAELKITQRVLPPVADGPIDNVFHWADDPDTTVEDVDLASYFNDPNESSSDKMVFDVSVTTVDATGTVLYATIVPDSQGKLDELQLAFTRNPGAVQIDVSATEAIEDQDTSTFVVIPALKSETLTFDAYNIKFTGITVQENSWDDQWVAPRSGNVLWSFNDYRWEAQIEPAVVIPMISTLEWDGTPWSGEAYGQSFTLNTDDTNPSDWVYGDLPTGYWQITPDATFQSGSDTCQVKLATPVQFVDLAVSSLTWESAAPGGGADYDISKGKLFVDGNLPVDHQVTVDVRTSPPLPPGWSAEPIRKGIRPSQCALGRLSRR